MRPLLGIVGLMVGFLLTAACGPTMTWYPRKARYADLDSVTRRAVMVYEGDEAEFDRCNAVWLGDLVCDPKCNTGGYDIQFSAAHRGATHIKLADSGSERVGTSVSATSTSVVPGVATASGEAHDVYASWEKFHLYRVDHGEQLKCLSEELRSEN